MSLYWSCCGFEGTFVELVIGELAVEGSGGGGDDFPFCHCYWGRRKEGKK